MAGVSSNDSDSDACRVTGPETAGSAKSFATLSTSAVVISGSVIDAAASIGPVVRRKPARTRSTVSGWSS